MVSSGMLSGVALVRTNISEGLRVFLCSVRWLLVTASVVSSSPIRHPGKGGAKFLRNVSSYKSHTV
jgi:hypothetical protein